MYTYLDKENRDRDIHSFKSDIKSVDKWSLLNELTINIKKTKLQFFPHDRNIDCGMFERDTVCTIYNQEHSYVNSLKYLDTERNRNLNMKNFFDAKYKLVNHKLYFLTLIRSLQQMPLYRCVRA